jgi:hypothetical protein
MSVTAVENRSFVLFIYFVVDLLVTMADDPVRPSKILRAYGNQLAKREGDAEQGTGDAGSTPAVRPIFP